MLRLGQRTIIRLLAVVCDAQARAKAMHMSAGLLWPRTPPKRPHDRLGRFGTKFGDLTIIQRSGAGSGRARSSTAASPTTLGSQPVMVFTNLFKLLSLWHFSPTLSPDIGRPSRVA